MTNDVRAGGIAGDPIAGTYPARGDGDGVLPAAAAHGSEADAAFLNRFLAGRDVPCPRCGYNLRDLVGGRCPECGDALQLRVGLAEPRMGPYVVLLSAGCLGLGGSVMFAAVAALYADADWWAKRAGILLAVNLAANAALVAGTLAGRRRFRRMPTAAQRPIALAACGLVAALAAAFVGLFQD